MPRPSRTLLIANPGLDVYGSDLQMLQTVAGAVADGWRVVVVAPSPGPLADRLRELGAETYLLDYPVLRRADASGLGLIALGARAGRALPRMRRFIRAFDPDVVYVNTVTIPWWLAAARSVGKPSIAHVHEAEVNERKIVRRTMAAPLRLATRTVMNSKICLESNCAVVPGLRTKARLIYNGVEPPVDAVPDVSQHRDEHRLVVIGRISPRKAPHVALEAVALLRARGWDVSLEVCGTPVPGQEQYLDDLQQRARAHEINNHVRFSGYASPVWSALARNDVLVAPSTGESFGNTVVEAQLARRPVIASEVVGHTETVLEGQTGLLVPVNDPVALADGVEQLLQNPELADELVRRGHQRALECFSSARYRSQMIETLMDVASA